MSKRFMEVHYSKDGEVNITVRPRQFRLLPSSATEHLRQANREVLLAIRDVLDGCLEWLESDEEPKRQRRRIQVQEG